MTEPVQFFLDAVTADEIRGDAGELFPILERLAAAIGVPIEVVAIACAAHEATKQGKAVVIFPGGHDRTAH